MSSRNNRSIMTMNNNNRIKTSTSTQERLLLSNTDIITTIRVPTFSDKKIKELDLQSMKEEDLKLLKKEDPFLYYSIPEVNKATLSHKEIDYAKASQSAAIVRRKARLTFECHPSLAMDDLLLGDLFLGQEESDLGELDVLSEFLFNTR